MSDTPTPRLGAALIFGGTAERAVHIHTDQDGAARLEARLRELENAADGGDLVSVIAVFGSPRSALADMEEFDIPAAAVDDLAKFALNLNLPRPTEDGSGDVREQLAKALSAVTVTATPAEVVARHMDGLNRVAVVPSPAAFAALVDAVVPLVEAERRRAVGTERAAIVKGVKEYFAPVDDPLYEDVQVLCGRIERGEYGVRGESR